MTARHTFKPFIDKPLDQSGPKALPIDEFELAPISFVE